MLEVYARKDKRSGFGILKSYSYSEKKMMPKFIITKEQYDIVKNKEDWVLLTQESIRENNWGKWINWVIQ